MTPEGKVKAKVNRLLDKYPDLYRFMPVPYGMGASSLDYLICYRGRFLSVETKAPGGKPTQRQEMIIETMRQAGGTVFVIDGVNGQYEVLEAHLNELKNQS